MSELNRRDILRTLAAGVAGGAVLQIIPVQAAAYAHQMVMQEKAASPTGQYTPKYFTAAQYATLVALCNAIIPKDDHSGGASEAGAPEFIDLLTKCSGPSEPSLNRSTRRSASILRTRGCSNPSRSRG